MAITCVALYQKSDAPAGAASVTDPEVSLDAPKQRTNVTVAVSGTANASAATGFDAVLAAIEAAGEGAIATAAGLDASETINMVAYVHDVTRGGTQATIWQTGTEQYTCDVTFQWEV